jgi:hypothetical protein
MAQEPIGEERLTSVTKGTAVPAVGGIA